MSVDELAPPGTSSSVPPGPLAGRERAAARPRRTARQERRQRHPGRGRRFLLAAAALGAAGALWWAGWSSPLTSVEHVVVQAPPGIPEKAVRKASGIAATDHVPAVNAARVRANVMASLPAVADVQVRRSLPHTVSVTVTPRTPFAVLPRGDQFVVIDTSGVEFDHIRSPGGLPVVQGLSYEGGVAARAVVSSLPAELLAQVRMVRANTAHDVDLTLSGGAVVRWGSVEQPLLKAQVLAGLRSVKAHHYDVSAPMTPTTSG